MSLLEKKSPNKIGLIGHCIINYPNPEDSKKLIDIFVKSGVDLIELQIPFSEPIADGPIFAKANQAVIDQGITIKECYDYMQEMTSRYSIPFVFTTYANIAFKQGFKTFVERSKKAGARGAIIPDLPQELAVEYYEACNNNDFAAISMVSPNISQKRLEKISPYFEGFVYAMARAGVTGAQTEFGESIEHYLKRIKEFTALPVAVGFGIRNRDDLRFLRGKADYAVIGTKTINVYNEQGLSGVEQFWQELTRSDG